MPGRTVPYRKATGVDRKLPKVSLKTGAGRCMSNPLENMLCALRRGPRVASRDHYTHLCGATLCLYSEKSLDEEEVWELLLTRFCTLPSPADSQPFPFLPGVQKVTVTVQQGTDVLRVTKTSHSFGKRFAEKLRPGAGLPVGFAVQTRSARGYLGAGVTQGRRHSLVRAKFGRDWRRSSRPLHNISPILGQTQRKWCVKAPPF